MKGKDKIRAWGIPAGCLLLAMSAYAASADEPGANDFNAPEAFVEMPAKTLDLLTKSMRLDMLEYYRHDSIAPIMNNMEGYSHLVAPMTEDYLKVQVTPVTTLTLRILPKGKSRVLMTIYTIGDSLQAADSEIRFYDERMHELKRDKFISIASSEDFFDFGNASKETKREVLDLVPFPTVEYEIAPEGDRLLARLTVGEFLGKEDMEKISPYLRRERTFVWTGNKFKLER